MKKAFVFSIIACLFISSFTVADSFGTGANHFEIDFVTISGDASSANGTYLGYNKTFNDPSSSYRIGKFEITNEQWNKFKADIGVSVTGDVWDAYNQNPYWTAASVPTNMLSWFEAAQFVNYLNTSTGHQAAYKFTGTQGTNSYSFVPWSSSDNGFNQNNPFRNNNAYYFLPTEDEWVKAAYWNDTNLQTYATKAGETLHPGDGVSGTGWNYLGGGPWVVGSGSEELNGTFDMMGNVWEWMESPDTIGDYFSNSFRTIRGGQCFTNGSGFGLAERGGGPPEYEDYLMGFRVASVPEPATLSLLAIGGLLLRKRK